MGPWFHGMARRTEEIELNRARSCKDLVGGTESSNPLPSAGESISPVNSAAAGRVRRGLWLVIDNSIYGARLRAAVDNPRMAQAVGMNVCLLFTGTFVVGCALAGLGGAIGAGIRNRRIKGRHCERARAFVRGHGAIPTGAVGLLSE